jgi:hypothetical protein
MASFSSRVCVSALVLVSVVVVSSEASAQLHSDASLSAGLEKRFLSSRGAGVPDAGPGPRLDLRGHVALFPFVRVGAYGAYAFAPQAGEGRHTGSLGAHFRLVSPVPRTEAFSLWLGVGVGYARTWISGPGALSGGFVEVPLGVGAGYRFRKPFSLFGEVQSVFGVGHHGSAYAGAGGADGVGLSLAVGLLADW